MNWSVVFYSDQVEAEILKMPAGFVARFIRYAERMEIYALILECRTQRRWVTGYLNSVLKQAKALLGSSIARESADGL